MLFNSAMEDFLRKALEQEEFASALKDLECQNPISIEISPVDLLFIITLMQGSYRFNTSPNGKEYRKQTFRICKQFESDLEPSPIIKKKIDERWGELGVQGLD